MMPFDCSSNTSLSFDDSTSCSSFGSIPIAKKKQVTFSTLEIREYPLVLGINHPSTVRGPAIEMDWNSQCHEIVDLESYETERIAHRRTEQELLMTVSQRTNL